jgi:hypothetical protein
VQLSTKQFSRPERVRVTGPGLVGCKYVRSLQPLEEQTWATRVEFATMRQKSYFEVERIDAGPGELCVAIADERRVRVPYDLEYFGDTQSDTHKLGYPRPSPSELVFRVLYYPPRAGTYSISVELDGRHIDGSPFAVDVAPPLEQIDLNGLGAEQLIASMNLNSARAFPDVFAFAARELPLFASSLLSVFMFM